MSTIYQFDWVNFYKEFAGILRQYKNNRQELIAKIGKIYETTGISMPTLEKDNQIVDVDPFTVFGLFNKNMSEKNRLSILRAVSSLFDVKASVPSAFYSLPVLYPQNATFYYFLGDRGDNDIDDLWGLFVTALDYVNNPLLENANSFSDYFDRTIQKKGNGNSKITMGLYWIAPDTFINLDQRSTWYIYESGKLPDKIVKTLPVIQQKTTASDYLKIVEKLRAYLQSGESELKDFKELSYEAWRYSEEINEKKRKERNKTIPGQDVAVSDDNVRTTATAKEELIQQINGYKNSYSSILIESKNLIFRGAPGTGKTYLAKEIAADIISNGSCTDYSRLSEDQKKQVVFVQFHPSYDYSDFVEGLRPKVNDDGTMGFELQDGIFKRFVARARKNYEDSQKTKETIEKEASVQGAMMDFFSSIELGVDTFRTINGNEFTITSVDDKHINISIPRNVTVNRISLNIDELRRMLESDATFSMIKDITAFFGKTFATQAYSYDFAIYKAIKAKKGGASKAGTKTTETTELKKYIFIIDEINRGEISKIFGELFFAIDPGYRGRAGEVSTQYTNMHTDPDEKFYVPENVYIIGTMNDIDRSVDSFDFAMRRRFRFVELKADKQVGMLDALENNKKVQAIRRMTALNKAIVAEKDLNENYQIGASYFLKLDTITFDQLWTDYLQPLLQEYVRGMYDEESIMNRFADAYRYVKPVDGDSNEDLKN